MPDPMQFGFHGIFDPDLIHIFTDGKPGFRLEQMGKIKFAVAGIFFQGGQGTMTAMRRVDILFDRIDDFLQLSFVPSRGLFPISISKSSNTRSNGPRK